jgi:hypothetical protein
MVWRGISWDGRTDLVLLNTGTLTGQRYIGDILDNNVRLYAGEVGDQFILMVDNARYLMRNYQREKMTKYVNIVFVLA